MDSEHKNNKIGFLSILWAGDGSYINIYAEGASRPLRWQSTVIRSYLQFSDLF